MTMVSGQLAPDGTLTAYKLVEDTTNAYHTLGTTAFYSVTSGTLYTFNVVVKGNGRNIYSVAISGTGVGANQIVNFDLTTGTPTTTSGTPIARSINLGNGWFQCFITVVAAATSTIQLFQNPNGVPYLGDGVSGLFILNPDLRPTNSGALLPPYQRVNTATDYDTVGFPLYLKCNGISSAMSTNSIDFTATDKMTVVTGVRKLSDVEVRLLLELSINTNLNNGAFVIAPNYNSNNDSQGPYWGAQVRGNVLIGLTSAPSFQSPITGVNTLKCNSSASLAELRNNGTIVATNNSSQGPTMYGNYPLYLFARNQASFFFNGNFYGAIIRGAQSDISSVVQTENYMAKQTGITF
jgi:hypothetical protein